MRKLTAAVAFAAATTIGCSVESEPKPLPPTTSIEFTGPSKPTTIESTIPSPMPTTTVERGVDLTPLLEAEAQLPPIEPARFASFIDTIKQNGEVLDWSEGSRYRVVAYGDDVVFTAELDFGFTPPTNPEELAAAEPEFIQVYARFPGEAHATHAFLDGSIMEEDGVQRLRPDGRANQLFGYDPQLPVDFDFSDRQGLLNNQTSQLQQSGAAAQELYVAAVEAVLGQ